MLAPQVTNTGSDVFFPRHKREGGEIGLHDDVREAAFPIAKFEVGQHVLCNVPAEKHIALSKAIFQGVEEVTCRNAFATIDSLYIGGANLDKLDLSLVNIALDSSNVHRISVLGTNLFQGMRGKNAARRRGCFERTPRP